MTTASVIQLAEALLMRIPCHFTECRVGRDLPPIPIKVWQKPPRGAAGQPLTFTFHGSIDRDRRVHPVFEGAFAVGVVPGTLIGIADPTLGIHPRLRSSWYQGSEGNDVPNQILTMMEMLIQKIVPSRVVITGGSAGGHPALFFSHRIPDSICVARNPHTRISSYLAPHIRDFRSLCWPSLPDDKPLSEVVTDDVGLLYEAGHSNTVVFVQNTTDNRNIQTQLVPFLARLPRFQRVLVLCEYFPQFKGHHYPPEAWAMWMRAAAAARTSNVEDILAACQASDGASAGALRLDGASRRPDKRDAEARTQRRRDLEIAQQLLATVAETGEGSVQ